MADKLTYKEYKRMVEEQAQAMLNTLAFVATGTMDVEVDIPEGIDVLTDLAIGFSYLVDDVRTLMREQEAIQADLEKRVVERTTELESALAEVRAVQQRYIQQEWKSYAAGSRLPDDVSGQLAVVSGESDIWSLALKQAIESRQPVIDSADKDNITLALPVTYADEPIGVLGFTRQESTAWDAEDIAAAEAVVEQVGMALENQRLFDKVQMTLAETENQARKLALLNEMSAILNSVTEISDVLKVAAEHSLRIFDGSYSSIALLDESSRRLQLWLLDQAQGIAPLDRRLSIADTAGGEAMRQNRVINQPDILRSDYSENPELAQQGVRSALIAPLVASGKAIGALYVGSNQPHTYTPNDESLMRQVGAILASTIESRRLFARTETALAETATLYQASAQLNSAQTYEDVLNVIRLYSLPGQRAHTLNLAQFDRPWTDEQKPEGIEILARWSEAEVDFPVKGYRFADLPSARLLNADQVTLFEDVANNPRLDKATRQAVQATAPFHSVIFAPIVVAGQWLGYIGLFFLEPARFREADIHRLLALARQASVTIQTIRLLDETNRLLDSEQRQRQIADTLLRSARNMAGLLSETELRETIIDEIFDILKPDQVNFYEWIATDNLFYLDRRQLAAPDHAEDAYQRGDLIAPDERPDLRQVFEENQSLLNTTSEDGSLKREHYLLPWLVGGQPAGVIEVFHTAKYLTIRPEDQMQCEGVVQQADIAIQSARLFEQEQTRARREQALREISAKIRGSADVDTVMRTAVREIGQILGRRTLLYLSEEKNGDPKQTKKEA